MPDQPDYTSENAPDVPPEQDDVEGHGVLADQAPGFATDQAPGVRTYPKAADDDGDDGDDVSGHVYIESKDDSGTRRDH
jgi:hypothetical protein